MIPPCAASYGRTSTIVSPTLANNVILQADSSIQVGGTGQTLTLSGPVSLPGAGVTRTITFGANVGF